MVDAPEHIVCKGKMLFTFPLNAALCQHVMITAYPKADAAVAAVCYFRIGQRVKIQIYDIIQRTNYACHKLVQVSVVLHRNTAE